LPATSSPIPVNAQFSSAVGGTAISADTTGGAFTPLTGPTYSENIPGDAGAGTIVLNAAAGFVFDTGGTAPTVRIDRTGGIGSDSKNINGVTSGTSVAMTSVNATQVVFTITSPSSGPTCKLTWQNIRVRPSAGAPLLVAKLTKTGTSVLAGVTNGVSNFGMLRDISGVASRLGIQIQPSLVATAGVSFAQQPVVRITDQFGNLRSAANGNADNGTVVTAARLGGAGSLQGSTSVSSVDGLATFTNLFHTLATNITVGFSSGSLAGTNSVVISVRPANAIKLVFARQPAGGAVGSILGTQPVICSCDAFGNNSSVGLSASAPIAVSISSGSGSLMGATTLDIGTAGGNGTASFTNLSIDSAGTDKQLTATAAGLASAISGVFTVAKGNQTISFGPLQNKTYGDAPFDISATASSGLPVSFVAVAGPASVTGSTITISGAGPVTIRAIQNGNSNWNAATPADQGFGVAKSVLTLRADNQSRAFGAANPQLTWGYSGFVNGDGPGVLAGAASISTLANGNSSVAGSPYDIVISRGTLSATNYSFAFVNGQMTITQANSTISVSSSLNPWGSGTNIPFVANVTAVAPGAGIPTGAVQFKADGNILGPPVVLSNGTAVITQSVISHGIRSITAEYAGDGNFVASTSGVPVLELINNPPVAQLAQYSRYAGRAVQIPISDLLSNFTTDVDGDQISLVSVGAGSNGANISITADFISYYPSATNTNRNTTDYIQYIITDGFSNGMATNQIEIGITGPDPGSQPPVLSPLVILPDRVLVRFAGIGGYTYAIQRTSTLSNGVLSWSDLGSVVTDNSGFGEFPDTTYPAGQAFYRVVWRP